MFNRKLVSAFLVIGSLFAAGLPASAQSTIAAQANYVYSAQDLDQLLQPLALYPDDVLAVALPAATDPQQIQLAAQGAATQDPNVQALTRYPNVLGQMSRDLAWTSQVGQAFANQGQDVSDSIQRLRAAANVNNSAPPVAVYGAAYDANPYYNYYNYGYNYAPVTFGVNFANGRWNDRSYQHRSTTFNVSQPARQPNFSRPTAATYGRPVGSPVNVPTSQPSRQASFSRPAAPQQFAAARPSSPAPSHGNNNTHKR